MGGGIKGSRIYPRTPIGTTRLDSYEGESPKKRVFISFHVEDKAQVQLLREQKKNPKINLEFADYSVKEAFTSRWRAQCRERIAMTSVVICMIGRDTHSREAVLWELKTAYQMGKKVIGVRIYKDKRHKIPAPLREHNAKILDWDTAELDEEINSD